jgi:hypothetical protein
MKAKIVNGVFLGDLALASVAALFCFCLAVYQVSYQEELVKFHQGPSRTGTIG